MVVLHLDFTGQVTSGQPERFGRNRACVMVAAGFV